VFASVRIFKSHGKDKSAAAPCDTHFNVICVKCHMTSLKVLSL
jgi:hypothetical protein